MMHILRLISYLLALLLSAFSLSSCEVSTAPIPHTYPLYLDFDQVTTLDSLQKLDLTKLEANIIAKNIAGDQLFHSCKVVNGGVNGVLSILSSTDPGDILEFISYRIQNPELMGDSAVHVLETKWSFSNNNTQLTEVSLDGIVLNPKQSQQLTYYSIPKR